MTKLHGLLVAFLAVALISCGESPQVPETPPTDDTAIVEVVLRDFANWEDVTFGNLKGVLALDPVSADMSEATFEGTQSQASNISDHLSKDLIEAFLKRNRSTTSIASLVEGSQWARIYQLPPESSYMAPPPQWAKATGALTLPGYSRDRSRAFLKLHHSWSIHLAVVTYVLEMRDGTWRIVAKDQAVYL